MDLDLLDRLLEHDAWTTRRVFDLAAPLTDAQLDRNFDIGHRTVRETAGHIVRNVEVVSVRLGEGLRELHARLLTRRLERMFYGLAEFEVRDPDGYAICLSQELADASDRPTPEA
jgi:uncharacterized damage-inducible protein DinB